MNHGSKVLRRGAALVALAGWMGVAQAQMPDPATVQFRTEKLADNLHVLFGAGGNVAVLSGSEGTLLVDSELVEMSAKLRAAVAMVADQPARFLLNTHFHFDHAGGNLTLGRGGAVIVAHENVRKHLGARQVINVGVEIVTEAMAPAGLPVVTFEDGLRLHLNGEAVAFQHVTNAHTDSDAFVFFENANALHTGDLFMSIGYPFVDSGNGGTLDGLIAAHAKVLLRCNEKTRVIPGHGPIVGRADLQAYHDMLVTVRKRVRDLIARGRSQEQVVAAAPTKDFDERWGKGLFTPTVFTQRVFVDQMRAKSGN